MVRRRTKVGIADCCDSLANFETRVPIHNNTALFGLGYRRRWGLDGRNRLCGSSSGRSRLSTARMSLSQLANDLFQLGNTSSETVGFDYVGVIAALD